MTNAISDFDFNEMVILRGSEVITTSFNVAKHFNKQHKDVLKAIRRIDCSKEFTKRNFTLCHEINHLQNGKPQSFYKMTKDGFMFLVMGFTGKKAAQIKEAYINAFNWMYEQLNNSRVNYESERNALMLEFMKEKDIASLSGKLLRRWGKQKKPSLLAKIRQLEEEGQIKLLM